MPCTILNFAGQEGRYVQRTLPGFGCRPVAGDIADGTDLLSVVEAVLAGEPDDEELTLIALDRGELGFLSVGHIAAVLNWILAREPSSATCSPQPTRCTACHRPLTDDLSRQRGFGPICWDCWDKQLRSVR